jgi:hypothetical protein
MIDTTDEKINYPPLEKPEFQPTIPPHLLKDVDPSTKYVLEQLDMITQQSEWLIKAAVDTNTQVRHTNGRIRNLESWRHTLEEQEVRKKLKLIGIITNFWSVVLACITVIGGLSGICAAIVAILDYISKHHQ